MFSTRRPDGEVGDPDTEIVGYVYRPNGARERQQPILPARVAHFFSTPDPLLPWRGMSWLQPVVTEVMADNATNVHKRKFFENGATPNMVVTLDPNLGREDFEEWIELFETEHKGAANAYKRLFLGGGADAKVVGADMRQLDFKVTQAHGETRICNAAGIPPIIVGISEGLDSATYSNYGQARRAWADGKMRPAWGQVCSVLSQLVEVPGGCELWYDDRHIPFLQDDRKDLAEIQQAQAQTIRTLIDAGFKPQTAVQALESGNWSALVHSGLYSVQLQPPGTTLPAAAPANGANGRALALICTHCRERAGENHACPRCRELRADVERDREGTVDRLAAQLGVERHLLTGDRPSAPPRMVPLRNYLNPVAINGNGRY